LSSDDSSNDDSTNVQTNPLGGGATSPSANAGSTGANVSGASTSASGGSGSGNAKAPSSTGFTNVNQYVNANADQSAGLGNAIAQNVNQQASQGLQGLSQASQDFGNQVAAQSANPNTYSTQNVDQTLNADIANPTGTNVQSDIQQYNNVAKENSNFAAGTNNTPSSLTQVASYSPADAQLQQAEQAATLTGTESGRDTLLQGGTVQSTNPNNPNAQITYSGGFSRPDYSTGQVNLDQLLLQNTPQNASTLTNLQSNLLGQYGLSNTENQAIQNAATTRQNDIQGTQQAAQNIQDVLYGIPTGTLVDASGNPVYSSAPVTTQANPTSGGVQNNVIATPVQGPTATTAPIVNQQYGLLTNLYNQLVAQPGQETAQQQATLTADQQNLTNYLSQTYGSTILGVPVSTLVQQAFTPAGTGSNSSGATANIVNTMTPAQLAQLQTLNQFAGLSGTNINQIGQTGAATTQVIDPTQVGTNSFNPAVNNNIAAAQNTVNQAQQAYTTDITTQVQNAFNQPVQYNGQTLSGQAGVQSALSNVNINMHNPSGDATQLSNYYNTLNNQLNTVNQTRQAYGQPPVMVPYSAVQAAQQAITSSLNSQLLAAGFSQANANNWMAKNDVGGAIDAAANLTAMNQTLQNLQSNPLQGISDQLTGYNPDQTYSTTVGGPPGNYTQGFGPGRMQTPSQLPPSGGTTITPVSPLNPPTATF
jgi:hypothetical protein